jgi:hypothetical protein
MPTNYDKLRALCPVLEKKEDELQKTLLPPGLATVILDTMGNLNTDALEAQPKLAEEQRRAFETNERAHAQGDWKTADKAFTDAYAAGKKSMDNLREVCRAPSPPLVS